MIKKTIHIINKISKYNYKNKIEKSFVDLDKLTKKIMKNGLKFCSIIGIIALIILLTYNLSITTPFLFNIGFLLFKLSLTFAVEFIICGLVVDSIKKQLI